MPMWRCPHCGTPQAETSRCWVCRRSSTSCGTCRHFRRSVAAQLGYCGLDRQRAPLHGDEIRACWDAAPAAADTGSGERDRTPAFLGDREPRPRLDFVPVERDDRPSIDTAAPTATLGTTGRAATPDGVGLWAELD